MDAFLNRSGAAVPKPSTKVLQEKNNSSVPWVEKYRPRKVSDVIFQDEVVAVLKKVLGGADLPNLLFYGPPGTGKTSAAVALCRQLFRNSETYADRVLELNASDERGIGVVRTKIKEFAHRSVASSFSGDRSIIGLKVVILDEADAMTASAQAALRRTMEKETRTTRFFLICNYISRIIDPLTSRCAKFRFKSLPTENQEERLKWICEQEKVEIETSALNELIELCEGDMRKSVTSLQTVSSCHKRLTPTDVRQFLGAIPSEAVDGFFNACQSSNYNAFITYIEEIKRQSFDVYQLISQVFRTCLTQGTLSEAKKAIILQKIGICEFRILDGADEFLQLMDLGICIMEQLKSA